MKHSYPDLHKNSRHIAIKLQQYLFEKNRKKPQLLSSNNLQFSVMYGFLQSLK